MPTTQEPNIIMIRIKGSKKRGNGDKEGLLKHVWADKVQYEERR